LPRAFIVSFNELKSAFLDLRRCHALRPPLVQLSLSLPMSKEITKTPQWVGDPPSCLKATARRGLRGVEA
jgi:hypothetical protein